MAAPVLTSITPSSGLSVGDDIVRIIGTGFNLAAVGSVTVTFGGIPAILVKVAASTLLIVTSPGGSPDAGVVDVVVSNVTPQMSGPPVVEPATLTGAWSWHRHSIAVEADFSNHSILALVTRTLVSEFQRTVIKNVRHDLNPDYADALNASQDQPQLAQAPSLKILGPRTTEDRWLSVNEPISYPTGGGNFSEPFMHSTVMAEYSAVGIGRTPEEASNLWLEFRRYFNHNQYLLVTVTSSALGNEVATYELAPMWEEEGDFRSHATRQGLCQWTAKFLVKGIPVAPDQIDSASFEVTTAQVAAAGITPVVPVPGPQDNPENTFGFKLPANPTPPASLTAEITEFTLPEPNLQAILDELEVDIADLETTLVVQCPTGPIVMTSRRIYTNQGALGPVEFDLPAATPGASGIVYVQAAQLCTIKTVGGNTLRLGSSVGTQASASVVGNFIRFVAVNSTEWVAFPALGTWTIS